MKQYSEITIEEYEKLINLLKIVHLKKEALFLHAGERTDTFGFVVSGVLRLFYTDAEGNEFNKSFCMARDFVASYSALLLNRESRLSIQALEPTTLMIINYNGFLELASNQLCWEVLSKKIAEQLYIKKEQRESELLLDSAEVRYLNFLRTYPNLENVIKQYHIASYLGITPVSLSRIRAKLNKS